MNPDWINYVVPGLLIAARWSGLMLSAPFFGSSIVAPRVKAALVAALTFIFLPLAPRAAVPHSLLACAGGAVAELVAGLFLGLCMQIVVEGAVLAGTVVGFQVGLGLETAIDPTTQADSTVLSTMHQMVVLLLMLQLGVHRWMLQALNSSFSFMPLGAPLVAAGAGQLLFFASRIWTWGLQMALPIVLVTLAIDLALAFFAKAAPQLPVMFLGIPIKLLCGYFVLMMTVQFWPRLVGLHAHETLNFFLAQLHGA